MASKIRFRNFDDVDVYRASQASALDESTRNFIVEFGKAHAHIAFNLGAEDYQEIYESKRPQTKPVRWMYAAVTPLNYVF
jgi:hypothetical protein